MEKKTKVKKKLFLKIAPMDWMNASRDMREMRAVREMGLNVITLCKGDKSGERVMVEEIKTITMSTRPLGNRMPKTINRVISVFTWAMEARKIHPDIISGHDPMGVVIGLISNVGKRKKTPIIYDSHEFTLETKNRGPVNKWFTMRFEKYLIDHCAITMEVSDVIAEEVQKAYKLEKKPLVVRNVPNLWNLDKIEIEKTREELLKALHCRDDTFIAMYHGMLFPNRGIEDLIDVAERIKDLRIIILGDGSKDYINSLKKRIDERGIENRALIHEAVPVKDLYKFVCASNVGFICGPYNVSKSYYYSLPNKFFENIQGGTPVILSEGGERHNYNEKYHVGIEVDSSNPEAIAEAITKMRTDKELYETYRKNCMIARQELCWEKEKLVLQKAYKEVIETL